MKTNGIRNILKTLITVCAFALVPLTIQATVNPVSAVSAQTVYVSSSGSDSNAGTENAPYASLNKAIASVANGGTVVLQDTVTLGSWNTHNKTLTVTGGGLNTSNATKIYINDSVTFENVTWQNSNAESTEVCVFANGHKITFGEGNVWEHSGITLKLFGGKYNGTVAGTDLTVLSGTYTAIYGGGYQDTVTGNTNLVVGGTVNSGIDAADHDAKHYIYGGGYDNTIQGSSSLTFGGSAKAIHLFGGSNVGKSIAGGSYLTVTGGTSMSMYGGNKSKDVGSGATTVVTGGTFEQIFGGNESASMTGNVDLRVLGGTISRRIYGGCYNNTSGLSFSTNYSVNGNINLVLGSKASITYAYDGNDKSVYAHSRHSSNANNENANLIFADSVIYGNYKNDKLKLKAQDTAMKLIIGSLSVADSTHYYTYEASGNVLTQNCAYHTLNATATVSQPEERYACTGNAIEPITVAYSNDWEYDKPIVSYANNINAGTASYSVTAGTASISGTFEIIETPVILGASVRLSEPSGLRFQSKVSTALANNSEATFGTLIIPKSELGENELTKDTQTVVNIPQTKWATESVKTNYPENYEAGYEYFNAVLTNIPEAYYGEVIVARSYVCIDGEYYYSEEIERSIAQVAAYALQDGYTDALLYKYVDTVLANETLEMDVRFLELTLTEERQLTVLGANGYAAIWSSSNANIVSVDKNGKVTALKCGSVVITAKIGNKTVTCEIYVDAGWTDFYSLRNIDVSESDSSVFDEPKV